MIIHVLFNSPERRHPELLLPGLVLGLLVVPDVNSFVWP
jgi:hypothetical protein